MIFRRAENQISLNLKGESVAALQSVAGVGADAEGILTTEEKVKRYFEEFREPVFRYLVYSFGGSAEQSEEITQEVFLRLFKAYSSGQSIANPRAWIYRVAHNVAIDQLKGTQFLKPMDDREWDDLQASIVAGQLDPEQALIRKDQLNRVRAAIGRLTQVERECLGLRTKGLRYREIGEILEIGTTTVADTLHRAIAKIARETNV
ncbi:MAG TPA: sigma-70 family RNA polymerase sigma factor [Pyrinomonadaceae bacterium]|nr:sigma-70 family RNA polymerase sigma factor [Pyrinomonadaceae bacterium]